MITSSAPYSGPVPRAGRPRKRSTGGQILLVGGTVFACLFCGLLSAVLPWWLILIMLALPLLVLLGHLWPFLGLLGMVVLTSGMVPSGALPQVPLGPGKVLGMDIALCLMLGLGVLKCGNQGLGALRAAAPVLKPIGLLLLSIPLCSAVAYLFHGTMLREVLNEARMQIYWLLALLPLVFVREPRDLNRIMWGLVWIGLVLSALVVAQFFTGAHLLENARVEDLRTLNNSYSDVTRSTAGGAIYLMVLPLLFLSARMLTRTLSPLWALPLMAALAAGIIVSFGRGIWISTAAALMYIAWHLGGARALNKLLVTMVIGVALAVAGLAAVKPHMIDAAVERFTSTFEEGSSHSSLGDRFIENSYAIKKIIANPVLGIGYGTAYKPRLDLFADWSQIRYIHNSYLGLWLKLGLLGPIAAVLLMVAVIRRARLTLKRPQLDPRARSLGVACLAGFVVPLVTSVTQPEWLTVTGIAYFAVVAGLIAAVEYQTRSAPDGGASPAP